MNVLFALYGGAGSNSFAPALQHAIELSRRGHRCAVAVPEGENEVSGGVRTLPYADALDDPGAVFGDPGAADVILGWTPREVVRRFVTIHQARRPTPWVMYLEDNEDWIARQALSMVGLHEGILLQHSDEVISTWTPAGLSHVLHYRDFIGLADGAVVIQDKLRADVPPWVPCSTVHPGVDLEAFRPMAPDSALRERLGLAPGERVLAYPGGLNDFTRPGLEALCRAVHLINESGTPCRLVRTGPVALDFLDRLPAGAASHVLDLGVVARGELPALLALADVLVQPGRRDAFDDLRLPGKLPEFFASGRPVVLPAANIAELLRDGEEAVLLEEGSPEEIADKCLALFADPARARRIGEGGRRFAERHFDPASQSAKLEAALRRAVEGFDPARARALWPVDGGAEFPALRLSRRLELLAAAPGAAGTPAAGYLTELAATKRRAHDRERGLETGLAVRDADLARYPGEVARLQAALAERRVAADTLDRAVKVLQGEVSLRDATIQSLREEAVRQDSRLAALEASLSWRITAPLRWLLKRLGGR